MTDERDEERDGSAEERRRRFRVVSAPAEAKPLAVDEDELRASVRRVQRPAKRRGSPPDDPPRAA